MPILWEHKSHFLYFYSSSSRHLAFFTLHFSIPKSLIMTIENRWKVFQCFPLAKITLKKVGEAWVSYRRNSKKLGSFPTLLLPFYQIFLSLCAHYPTYHISTFETPTIVPEDWFKQSNCCPVRKILSLVQQNFLYGLCSIPHDHGPGSQVHCCWLRFLSCLVPQPLSPKEIHTALY